MASPFELIGISSTFDAGGQTLPTANTVLGTTDDTEMSVSLSGLLQRTEYMTFAAGSTHFMSTAAYLDRLVVVPVSTGAGVCDVALSGEAREELRAKIEMLAEDQPTLSYLRNRDARWVRPELALKVRHLVGGKFCATPPCGKFPVSRAALTAYLACPQSAMA
jgi:hypothetical protein